MAENTGPRDCGACWACFDRADASPMGYVLCRDCGNKRCPHAADHALECTGSNAPGQPGATRYPATPTPPALAPAPAPAPAPLPFSDPTESPRFKSAVLAMEGLERIHPRATLDALLLAAWLALHPEPAQITSPELIEAPTHTPVDAESGHATYWMSKAANLAAQLLEAEAALREARSYYGVQETAYVVQVIDGYTPTFTTRGLTVTAALRAQPVPGHSPTANSEESC